MFINIISSIISAIAYIIITTAVNITIDDVLLNITSIPANNEIIERSIEGTIKSDACVVGVPVKDTIKRANKEGYIIDTPNRSELWITQTPQSFKTDLVKMAYKKMKEELEKGNTTLNITDDAMVVEEFTTNQVRFVQGDYKNIKVTTPEDIDIAELFIELDAK